VTIRQIADEAGVPLALVGYYFGPKHELFHAIFEHWNDSIEARLAGLRAVPNDPADPRTLPRIIEAFIAPVLALRASAEGEYYALGGELYSRREPTASAPPTSTRSRGVHRRLPSPCRTHARRSPGATRRARWRHT
jgi:AcrR family transcriptional regulator